MRIGIVACSILRGELERLVESDPDVTEVVYLDAAIHVNPLKMKEAIRERIEELKGRVDRIFLGYGFCQSLEGIEREVDIPVLLPQVDDCIALLLTPERYAEEKKKELGTWFMTPGWAEAGIEMVFKELRLERAIKLGKDPVAMARRLFTHYRRGLYIHTGVGDDRVNRANAEEFCRTFNLKLETCEAEPFLLRDWFRRCKRREGEEHEQLH
jgi:hypothetical protein